MKPVLLAVALACASEAARSAPPPRPAGSTDPARCTWIWKQGGGLGVWTERCRMNGVWQPVFDARQGGFVIEVDGKAGAVVLRRFAKPAAAGIAAVLPELRQRGWIPDDGECVFEPAAFPAPREGVAFFRIVPVGARKAALEATPADEVPEPPCGDFGWSTHGVRYFMTDAAHPEAVVYFDLGQDGMMFDPATVRIESSGRRR